MSVVVTDVEATKSFWDMDRDKRQAFRPVSEDDLKIVLKSRPYLQIVGLLPKEVVREKGEPFNQSDFTEPLVIQVDNGWVIQYWPVCEKYPPAMSTSAGLYMWGALDIEGFTPPDMRGTISHQAFHVAMHMVMAAKQREWQAIQMVDGHRMMQWAVWAMAKHIQMPVYGFEATPKDEAKFKRVLSILERYEETLKQENVLIDSVAFMPVPGGFYDELASSASMFAGESTDATRRLAEDVASMSYKSLDDQLAAMQVTDDERSTSEPVDGGGSSDQDHDES